MAKKRLNKNLVVSLTLFCVVITIVVSALILQKVRRRDPGYFADLARTYVQQEEWEHAALFYRRAWEASHDASYLVSLGETLLHQGDVDLAVQSWQQALINEPNLTEAHLLQLDLLLELAQLHGQRTQWTRVKDAAAVFLASEAPRSDSQTALAHNANGLALISLVNQAEGDAEVGEAELLLAVELAPEVVDYALDLAALYLGQDRIDEGEAILDDLMTRHSEAGADASKIRLVSANYLASHDRLPEAQVRYEESLALAAKAPEALQEARLGLASFRMAQWRRVLSEDPADEGAARLYQEAETILKQCIEADPDAYDAYLSLVSLYAVDRRFEDVVETCELRLQRGLSRKGVFATRNRLQAFLLMIRGSEACVVLAVEARDAEDEEAREAWLAKADRYLADARGEVPSHPRVPGQAGRIKLARGQDRQALEDFRAAEDAYRTSGLVNWDNKLTLASLHLQLSETGAAVAVLEEAVPIAERSPGPQANRFWTLYARALFSNNDVDRAGLIADQVLLVDSTNEVALRVKAAILEQGDRFREAGDTLFRVTGDPVPHAMLLAEQHVLDGQVELGLDVLREALKVSAGEPRLVNALARLLIRFERMEEARTAVQNALTVHPDDRQLQALAVVAREDLTPKQREEKLLEIVKAQEDAYQRAVELVGFYLRQGNNEALLPLIDEALEHLAARDTPAARNATPDQHRGLLSTKISAAVALEDGAALDEARDEAVRDNVDGAGGKSILGLIHMYREEYDLAVRAFREAIEAQPTDARTLTHLGQCLQLMGRTAEAKGFFERAIRVNPNEGAAHKNLAVVASMLGDEDTYEQALKACERLIPLDPWVQSELLAQKERINPREAITRRLALLQDDPDDLRNLERLAVLYEAVKAFDQADGYCERILALRPDDQPRTAAIARYYERTGRPELGLTLLTRFAESRSSNEEKANAMILVASGHLTSGDMAQAESTLLAAAQLAQTLEVRQSLGEFYLRGTGEPTKALPWFDKAVEQARSEQSVGLAGLMAQRVACLLHADINDVPTARRYVDELLAMVPNDPQGLLLDGDVHARSGAIDRAVDSFSECLRQQPDNVAALYHRAMHLRTLGRLPAAIDDLEQVKRVDPLALNLGPRRMLAILHRQAGHTESWIRELESMASDAPDSVQATELLVAAYVQQQRLLDAERLVTASINRSTGAQSARWFFLRAQIGLALGNMGKAVTDAQQGAALLEHNPQAVATLLGICARAGRPEAGIAYYENHAPSEPATPEVQSRYGVLLAQSNRMDECATVFRHAMALAIDVGTNAIRTVAADLRSAFPSEDALADGIRLFEQEQPDGAMGRAGARILVVLYRIAARHADAVARIEVLITGSRSDVERADLYHALGDVHQASGQYDRSCKAYRESLKYAPDDWIVLNNLAYVLSDHLDDHEGARFPAEQAASVADNAATLDTLGWVYVGLGEYTRAIATLSRALRFDSGQALAYYHLGEAYRRGARPRDARGVLESGRDLARADGDDALVAQIDRALERVEDSDIAP